MKIKRRNFIKNATLGTVVGTIGVGISQAQNAELVTSGKLKIDAHKVGKTYKPLQILALRSSVPGTIKLADGNLNVYYKGNIESNLNIQIGGALGTQLLILEDSKGTILDTVTIKVAASTEIADKKGIFNELKNILFWSMVGEWGETNMVRYNNKFYRLFVPWLRDHTHTLKGMKYFFPYLKDGFELYKDSQREDGMIWDNIYSRTIEPNWWDKILAEGDFIRKIEGGTYEFKRQPVEADVEYLYVECLYNTWKATGDTEWMALQLDSCIKALTYATTDKYRWSSKFQLVKRGFTIDTWDFVHEYDQKQTNIGTGQCISVERNDFGVMHGDNTGMMAAFTYMAEMLDVVGRTEESKKYRQLFSDFKQRLDKVAWNGEYFTHYVPEADDFWKKRDIGSTDPTKQVSLSNAYALNRGITHEQAKAIINTYLKIKSNMPKTYPGEWYTIYPPFENGFAKDNGKWEYMNGGVTTIVAGELAHGAYEHGYETYATDILKRILALGKKHGNYLNCTFKGALPEPQISNFTTLSLLPVANADFSGKGAPGVPGWSSEGEENDLSEFPVGKQTFQNVPFDIIDPATNGRKACLIISKASGYVMKAVLPVNKKATSLYMLHARSKDELIATFTIRYVDDKIHTEYIVGRKIENWWFISDTSYNDKYVPKNDYHRVAWRGKNKKSLNVGIGILGLNNPYPDKIIKQIEFEGMNNSDAKWFIAGITLSDKPYYFDQGDVSFGIPDRWGAAACMYALVEGLAGVKDTGVAMEKITFSPRWESAGENEAEVTIKYEASGGYVSYKYKKSDSAIDVILTGNVSMINGEIYIPPGKNATRVLVNGKPIAFNIKTVEQSVYATFDIKTLGVHTINVSLT